jgi:nucleotide-binding universal stress UspA family protein
MPAADQAAQLGGLLAWKARAETTLFGIAERPEHEPDLRQALESTAEQMRANGISPQIVVSAGDPVRRILQETNANKYDLVVIGAERKARKGPYWRSRKTYEVIRVIVPPVLVAMGASNELQKFLVCTGGKGFIAPAVRLAGTLGAAVGATVTLLHVMAEPPAMYPGFIAMEEDLESLLESKSELGINLSRQKADLESLGVKVEVRLRHGFVLEEVFREVARGGHDLVVAGTASPRRFVRHYIMGDLTRIILNRAECSVLIARPELGTGGGFFKSLFGSSSS